MTDELFASEIAAFAALATAGVRETRWLGRSFDYRPSTESTNDDARALAREGAPHGTVVLADAQRAGRGRRGRVWHSPVGSNLYLSALVRPNLAVTDAPLLTLVTGLAVARACDRFVSAESVTVNETASGTGPQAHSATRTSSPAGREFMAGRCAKPRPLRGPG